MKKSVLFVINTMGQAGAEMAMLAMMKMFNPEEYDISLYVLMGQGEMIHNLPENVKLLNDTYCDTSVLVKEGKKHMIKTVLGAGINRANFIRLFVYLLANGFIMLSKRRIQSDKLLWRVLSDGAKRFDNTFDLAIAYLEGGSAYYVADHVNARKKAAFIHIDYGMSGYTRSLDKDCYLSFDRIFTVSDEVKENFLKAYPECKAATEVFHNFLDTERIMKKSMESGGFHDGFDGIRLLTVGRITYQKAYDIAVAAMKILKDDQKNVRWYVLGDGPEREKIQRLINENGLQKDFILLGPNSNPYTYFRQADIYVHATRFEGKSIAIQEAQVLKCVIVASDCNGNREQIENGKDGVLCPLTPHDIAKAIEELLDNKDLRDKYAKEAGKRIINHTEDMEMIYELLR
ncbi:MAG: glycosyltransferase [Lachnospira sp.]|nr:glycosyltransferase [Lachnospira sp.]